MPAIKRPVSVVAPPHPAREASPRATIEKNRINDGDEERLLN